MARKNPGPLSSEEISAGIIACIENAQSLFRVGEILLVAGQHAGALANILLADQENGKVAVLVGMAVLAPGDHEKWKRLWKHFREHPYKAAGGYLASVEQNISDLEWLKERRFATQAYGPNAERTRQEVLYVDFVVADRTWTSPWDPDIRALTRIRPLVRKTLERLLEHQQMGRFSPKALSIKKDVYSQYSPLTRPEGMNDAAYAEIFGQYIRLRLATYYDNLEAAGFEVPPDV